MIGGGIARTFAAAALALFVLIACALLGGATSPIDSFAAYQAAEMRSAWPPILAGALILTWFGSAEVTLPLVAFASLWLAYRGEKARAAILLIAAITARLSVDGLKLFVARARPAYDTGLAQVHSLSFPSGHAANSFVTYTLLALLVTARKRPIAIAAAAAVTLTVGATRVLIGVHWLSDVVGGWAFGLMAVLLVTTAERLLPDK